MREVSGLNLAGLPVTFPKVLPLFLLSRQLPRESLQISYVRLLPNSYYLIRHHISLMISRATSRFTLLKITDVSRISCHRHQYLTSDHYIVARDGLRNVGQSNQWTRLIAREDFMNFSHSRSFRPYALTFTPSRLA
jgi:hypothetical protein